MKEENYNITMDRLEKASAIANRTIGKNEVKIGLMEANSFKNQAEETFVLSLLPYLGLNVALRFMLFNGYLANITGAIPTDVYPAVTLMGSMGIGFLLKKLLDRIFLGKKKLDDFSNAKNWVERAYETLSYAVQSEQANNKKYVVELAMSSLERKQQNSNDSSEQNDIQDNLVSVEEVRKKVDELKQELEKRFRELDLLSKEEVLNEKINKSGSKSNQILNTITYGLIAGSITMMYYVAPFLLFPDAYYVSSNSHLFAILGPFLAGIAGYSFYNVKKNADLRTAARMFDNGEDDEFSKKVFSYNNLELMLDIDGKIDSTVVEASNILIELQENLRILEAFANYNDAVQHEVDLSGDIESMIGLRRR